MRSASVIPNAHRFRRMPHQLRMMVTTAIAVLLATDLRAQASMPAWRATELWRVDGTESGGEPFFDLRDFRVSKDGVVWALDFKDQAIRRYDANGKPLKTSARKGSGPGELGNANGLVFANDGSVWVNDPRNSRFTVFGADGQFLRQHTIPILGYGWRWEGWIDQRTGSVVDPFSSQRPGGAYVQEWRRIGPDGVVRDTLPIPSCLVGAAPVYSGYQAETKGKGNMYRQYPFSSGGGTAPDGKGGMWCAVPASTRVALVRIGKNDTIAQTSVNLSPVPVTPDERRSAIADAEKAIAQYASNNFDASKIPASKPPIAQLSVDDDGRLWVRHTARFGDTGVTFDIHDATGKHLGRLKLPHRPSTAGLPVRARGNDAWIAVLDDDDVVSIARYRLSR